MPSPPRIVIPPPTLYRTEMFDFTTNGSSVSAYEQNGFDNSDFLKTVTYGNSMNVDNALNWRYEMRREAQTIFPFLYLGPISAARDLDFLQREGITMVVAVRDTLSAQAKLLSAKAAISAGIESCTIDVSGNQELIAAFPRAIDTINAHLTKVYQMQQYGNGALQSQRHHEVPPTPGKVLVFCESGNERSAAVVAAYVMAMFSLDLVRAIQIVQMQRFCVSFDDSMRYLLQSYEAILRAKRDVARSGADKTSSSAGSDGTKVLAGNLVVKTPYQRVSKRTFDDTNDESIDVDKHSGLQYPTRFEQREGFAPFQDAMKP